MFQKSPLSIPVVLALAGLAAAQPAGQFRYWDVTDFSKAPRLLSQTGLYADIAAKTVVGAATYYEVNSPEWTDGALKKRWFLLKPGQSIGFQETGDYWDYPDSTVFAQTFHIDTVNGDSASRIVFETRLLILRKIKDPWLAKVEDRWHAFSYKWRAGGLEADLVPDTGLKATVGWWPQGRGPGKSRTMKKWVFPGPTRCLACHATGSGQTLHGRTVLGFFTAQLNRASPRLDGTHQLDDLFAQRTLHGVKPASWGSSPKWWGLKDDAPGVTTEQKSRAYIAANCSGCHGTRGIQVGATFGLDLNLDYHAGTPAMALEHKPASWPYNLDTLPPIDIPPAQVVPGYPEKSIILHRQKQRNTLQADDFAAFDNFRMQMPPLATFEVDEEAMSIIERWIREIPQTVSIPRKPWTPLLQPSIQGRSLHLPAGLAASDPAVNLVGIDGRLQLLPRISRGIYRIPTRLPAGLYVLRVGRETFTRYLF